MKVIPTFEERVKNPYLQIINFEYLANNIQLASLVWEKYKIDLVFKNNVDEKRYHDPYFEQLFQKYFSKYINNDRVTPKMK